MTGSHTLTTAHHQRLSRSQTRMALPDGASRAYPMQPCQFSSLRKRRPLHKPGQTLAAWHAKRQAAGFHRRHHLNELAQQSRMTPPRHILTRDGATSSRGPIVATVRRL